MTIVLTLGSSNFFSDRKASNPASLIHKCSVLCVFHNYCQNMCTNFHAIHELSTAFCNCMSVFVPRDRCKTN